MEKLDLTNERIEKILSRMQVQIKSEEYGKAFFLLQKILNSKVSFPQLDKTGKGLGLRNLEDINKIFKLIDLLVEYNAMGSYVIASSALIPFIQTDLEKVIDKTKKIIIIGDVWHVCDNVSERSLGYALVSNFEETLPYLSQFLDDENRWVKRSAGVAIHFFNKRVKDDPKKSRQLLELIAPHIEETQYDAVKGIGWGLKTIGKYHPELLVKFLQNQLQKNKKISKLMLKKALRYLSFEDKSAVLKYVK